MQESNEPKIPLDNTVLATLLLQILATQGAFQRFYIEEHKKDAADQIRMITRFNQLGVEEAKRIYQNLYASHGEIDWESLLRP